MNSAVTRLLLSLLILIGVGQKSEALNVCQGSPGNPDSIGINYSFPTSNNPFALSTAIPGIIPVKVVKPGDDSQGVMVPDPLTLPPFSSGPVVWVPTCSQAPDPDCKPKKNTYWKSKYNQDFNDAWEKNPNGFCVCKIKLGASINLSGQNFPSNPVLTKDFPKLVNLFYNGFDIFTLDLIRLGLFPDLLGIDSYKKFFELFQDPITFVFLPIILDFNQDFIGLATSSIAVNGQTGDSTLELGLIEGSQLSADPIKNQLTSIGYTAFTSLTSPPFSDLCVALGPIDPLQLQFTENQP